MLPLRLFFFKLLLVLAVLNVGCNCAEKENKKLSPSRLRAEGDAAFSSKDYTKALRYFNDLVDAEPNNYINWHKRALVYSIRNKISSAISDWSKCIEINPEFSNAYLYRGKAYKKLGACEKALNDFTKYEQLDPTHSEIKTLINDVSKCIDQYQEALKYIDEDNCQAAQPLIDELLEISPNNDKLSFIIIDCNVRSNNWQMVLKYAGNILRSDEQNLKALLLRGKAFYMVGEYEMALKHYSQGLQSDPEHTELKKSFLTLKKTLRLLEKAKKELDSQEYEDSIQDFNTILEIDPSHNILIRECTLRRCKAAVHYQTIAHDIRIHYCQEAVKHNGDNAEAYYLRGLGFKANGQLQEAEQSFQQAVEKDHNNREYQEQLHSIKIEIKKANRKDYYKILQIDQSASERDIKKAFRQCGLQHHPDVVANLPKDEQDYHEALFKECVEASEILSDPDTRRRYDAGEDVLEQMQGGNHGGFPFNFGNFQQFSQGGRTFTFRFGG